MIPIRTATVQSEPQPEGCACGRNLPVAALIDQFHAVGSIDYLHLIIDLLHNPDFAIIIVLWIGF